MIGVNIAPQASATGSVGNSPSTTYGTASNLIDESEIVTSGCFGLAEDNNIDTYTLTATIDLGSIQDLTRIKAKILTDVAGNNYAECYWNIFTSTDGSSYTLIKTDFAQPDYYGEASIEKETQYAYPVSARYVKIECEVYAYVFNPETDAVRFLIKEIEIYDDTEEHDGENIAPDGSATGSITGNPTHKGGTASDTIDENLDIEYGWNQYNTTSKTVTQTSVIDLGEIKNLSEIVLRHAGRASSFGELPNMGEHTWTISISTNGTDYEEVAAGEYILNSGFGVVIDKFDIADYIEQSMSARYVKVVMVSIINISQTWYWAAAYHMLEIEAYETSLVDIGLRAGSKSIGAKIATNDEPLRIFVNGTVYGIPWQDGSSVKIQAGEVKGLATLN